MLGCVNCIVDFFMDSQKNSWHEISDTSSAIKKCEKIIFYKLKKLQIQSRVQGSLNIKERKKNF